MANSTERAVLAGGCFWGMQDLIRRYPGVISTRVGYTGGDVPNATYRNHGNHAEAIEIIFDPAKISYRKLLEFFFQIHDPSTRNRQGNDVGAATARRSSTPATSRSASLSTPSPMSTPRACGRARRRRKWRRPARSGKPSPSIRIISSAIRTATPATSSARTGFCPSGPPRSEGRRRARPPPSLHEVEGVGRSPTDGVWKAGTRRQRLAPMVVQACRLRSSGPYPIRPAPRRPPSQQAGESVRAARRVMCAPVARSVMEGAETTPDDTVQAQTALTSGVGRRAQGAKESQLDQFMAGA